MRVTIDATSALLASAGVKSYVYHWIRALRKAAGPDQIRAFPYLNDLGRLNHQGSNVTEAGRLARIALLYFVNVPGNPALDAVVSGSGIFHASNQVHRAPRAMKLTATVHDLTAFLFPQFHTEGNVRADRTFADKILRRADGLIAVSEHTRQDAIRMLGIDESKITTIHSGVPDEYFDAAPSSRARPYVLYVGTIEPRKNLDTLLDAWRLVPSDLRAEFDLVFAGLAGWRADHTMARIRAEATYLGYVPEDDMPGLVAGATLFVYPSLYEGFGFPVVQAMAARVPVVTSNTSCLPEIAADGAAFADPASAAEIAARVTELLESASRRSELSRRGRLRAEHFRWDSCAARSLEFFHSVLA